MLKSDGYFLHPCLKRGEAGVEDRASLRLLVTNLEVRRRHRFRAAVAPPEKQRAVLRCSLQRCARYIRYALCSVPLQSWPGEPFPKLLARTEPRRRFAESRRLLRCLPWPLCSSA